MSEFHEGGCLCGAARYRLTGHGKWAAICHCTNCQKRTGSAFGISVYADDQQVKFLSGNLKSYRYRSDDGQRWVEMEFCENCGSTLSWTAELFPGLRGLAGGSFDDPSWYDIRIHVWTQSAHDWMTYPEGMRIHQATP